MALSLSYFLENKKRQIDTFYLYFNFLPAGRPTYPMPHQWLLDQIQLASFH
jgi:hypothetical protein